MAPRRSIGKIEPIQKIWLSAREAKAFLDCGDAFLQKLRDAAEISFSRFGNKTYWYDKTSLERFILRNKVN